jgi:type IV secretory pathway TrbD component
MVYEWDASRARRSRLTKRSLGMLAAVFIVGVPVWIAVNFGFYG